jgi:two-component system chemotaxis response regulator CheB
VVSKPENNTPNDRATTVFDIVAMAASADGLKALSCVLSTLAPEFPASIVVVQHLSPRHPSLIAQILNRCSPLLVKQAEQGCQLSAGKVFIAPPDYHLLVNPDGSLSLSQTEKVHFVRPAAENLFESVAQSYKDRAIAVVLTGGDGDGSRGVQAIKKMGGKVIVQGDILLHYNALRIIVQASNLTAGFSWFFPYGVSTLA